jgi:predicted signal transduction protein with EAL and GGDEF domain
MSRPEDVPESLLRRADLALYEGKEAGRNRVSVSSELMSGQSELAQPAHNVSH